MPRRRTYIAGVVSSVAALVAGCSGTDDTDEQPTESANATSTPTAAETDTPTPTAAETDTPTPTAAETENSTSVDEILEPPGPGGAAGNETETESPES